MTHSPEPWTAIPNEDRYEIDHDGNGSVIGCEGLFKEDAERIVACVNFCRQFPTEQLLGRQLVYIKSADDIGDRHSDGFVACTLIPIQKD